MSRPSAAFAIDTSAYTTSIAITMDGTVIQDKRILLKVPDGGRGLRQADAVFAHVKNLRVLFSDFKSTNEIDAVAYSEKPCPGEDSYMPVFCVGSSHAEAFASALGVKSYPLTHQHGHIYSAFFENNISDGTYGAFHVSGGTLDILQVKIEGGIVVQIGTLGGALDLTCGQLLDRVGVAAGLAFPAGAAMEKLYQPGSAKLAVHVRGLGANLSGAETQSLKRLKDGEEPALVCSAVFDCVGETLSRLVKNTAAETGISRFVYTGGVMAGRVIRERIKETCESAGLGCVLTQKEYCGDNACGLALAAERLHHKGVSN